MAREVLSDRSPMRAIVQSLLSCCAAATFSVACASTAAPAVPTSDGGVRADAGTPDAQAPDAGDPACEAYDATVQAGLDSERAKQKLKYATIASWTDRCGTRVFVSNDEKAPAITDAAFWRIGSVTKTYVAATILRLVELGKLSLDEKIEKWFPTLPHSTEITVRHLLNHSSGIFNYTETDKFSDAITATPEKEFTPEELIAMANEKPPTNAPGASFSYSNTNYIVLGRLIELVTGEKAHVVLRREVMVPAGLTQTFLDGPETVEGTFARGYLSGQDVTKAFSPSIAWTAGAMATTPGDLVLWLRAIYIDKNVVSPASFSQMSTSYPGADYGLGVSLFPPKLTAGAGAGYGHGGSIYGYQTQAFAFPDTKFALVAITGDSKGEPNSLSLVALGAFKTLMAAQ